jgi:hypothetical protein
MKTMNNHTFRSAVSLRPQVWAALIVLGGLGSLGTTIATAQDTPAATQSDAPQPDAAQANPGERTDGQIEMDVVHALDAAPALKQDWITAGTVQGEVTLSGTSASEANRQTAESIASKVPGVAKVVNNLKVGDPQQAAAQDTNGQPQDQYPGQSEAPGQSASNDNAPRQPMPPPQPQYGQDPNAGRPAYQPAPGQYPNQYPNQYPPQAQNQYPPQYPNQYPNQYPAPYQGQQRPNAVPEPPHAPVTLEQGTLLKVRTSEPLDSKMAKPGTVVQFTVASDVYAGGVLAIPRGATIRGKVTETKQAGAVGGRPELALEIDTLELGGTVYPLATDPFMVKGPNKAGRTAGNAFGGAVLGAIIGGAVGGGEGAAIGAGAGAVGGTAATAATPGPRVWIPTESIMNFHLNTPVTVTPVSQAEAQRLAGNAGPYPGQRPTLYRRGYYPPPPPPGYYYRPY